MAILPAGFALPPLPYLVGLGVGVAIVAGVLWRLAPTVVAATVLGLAPWMAVGSALHVLYVLEAAPPLLAPLFGTPAVYATGFVSLGVVWAGSAARDAGPSAVARQLGVIGAGVCVLVAGAVLASSPRLTPVWPGVALVAASAVTAAGWWLLGRGTPTAAATGWPGVLVLFAHVLDGVSTAVGVDVLGFGERTPISRVIMDVAAALPTAEVLGVGWLFVLVKLGAAGAVVVLFADLVEDDPRQGYLLLAVVAAVGLGPGVHNLLLYTVAS
jgi:uncharacterized membrane protein